MPAGRRYIEKNLKELCLKFRAGAFRKAEITRLLRRDRFTVTAVGISLSRQYFIKNIGVSQSLILQWLFVDEATV
jgi:hypothetical protein